MEPWNPKKLGFGLMRLPRKDGGEIDIPEVYEMADRYLAAGYTYFQESCVFDSASENLLAFAEWNYGTFHYYRIERR